MQELIDDLENSGIRFVYFSPYSESITKAFGDRLGLETDWNSCIIMSTSSQRPSMGAETLDFTDPKSKLPRGVHNIRPHLRDVDDIPLHISLFAECEPSSTAEMLKIYKENEDTVLVVGSTLNWTNYEVIAGANASIGMEPAGIRSATGSGRLSSMSFSASATFLTCPITLPFDCSPYVITELIREARCVLRASQAAYLYRLSLSLSLVLVFFSGVVESDICSVCFGTSLIFLANTAAHLYSPYEPEIMKLMPIHAWSIPELRSHSLHHTLRATLNAGALCSVYWYCVGVLCMFT